MLRNDAISRAFAIGIGIAIMLMVLAPALGGAQAASQPVQNPTPNTDHLNPTLASGVPIQQGGFITNDHRFLVFNGYLSFGGYYNAITNGTEVYAGAFVLVIYALTNFTYPVTISLTEMGTTTNQETTVVPDVADVVTLNLYQSNSWTQARVVVDGTPQYYTVAVPISLLPSYLDNIGGVDIIALGILSEALIALALALASAYAAQRRALWAPKFSLLVWGHVILIGLAAAVIVDFQWVDQTFAGWSPLVYAIFLWPIFFTFSLSYFNRAPKSEMLQANTPAAGRLSFNRWTLRMMRTTRGWELIGPKWKHWLQRLLSPKNGHVMLGVKESDLTSPLPEPFMADIINRRIPHREEILRRVRRPSPDKNDPLDDFDIIQGSLDGRSGKGDDLPLKLLFTPTGFPVEVEWPRWSMHKEVEVPEKFFKDGRTVAAHMVNRLSAPYCKPGKATITLHSIHFRAPVSVINGWRSVEDLGNLLDTVTLDLEALKAGFGTQVTRKVRERILAREALMGRGQDDLSELEAASESVREQAKGTTSLDDLFGRALMGKGQLTAKPRKEQK